MKPCRDCGDTKDLADFYSYKKNDKQYYASYCRKCHSARTIRTARARRYGLTVEEMEERLAKATECAICKQALQGSNAHFDHDHSSGVLRDILCSSCNLMLGHAHEDTATLREAIKYIQRHKKSAA